MTHIPLDELRAAFAAASQGGGRLLDDTIPTTLPDHATREERSGSAEFAAGRPVPDVRDADESEWVDVPPAGIRRGFAVPLGLPESAELLRRAARLLGEFKAAHVRRAHARKGVGQRLLYLEDWPLTVFVSGDGALAKLTEHGVAVCADAGREAHIRGREGQHDGPPLE